MKSQACRMPATGLKVSVVVGGVGWWWWWWGGVKGKAGMGGREIPPAQVLERCARWPEVHPVDLSFVRPLLGGLVVRRPGRGAADNKRGDYSRAHESPCGRPRGYAQGRLDSH